MRLLIITLSFIYISTFSEAAVINVPEDHDAIQDAISASENGDTVQVAPGEYVENINLIGRDISLLGNSENPAETIIMAADAGSVVFYGRGESRNSRLSGFTITGGEGFVIDDQQYGGGICIIEASPSIDHCIIVDNHVDYCGGAIACLAGSPRFDFCLVYSNTADSFGGAAFADWESSPEFYDCTFTSNQAFNRGGGLTLQRGSRVLVLSSILWGNAPQEIFLGDGGENIVVISFSAVQGGRDDIIRGNDDLAMWGAGAISSDPLLVDPDNEDFRPGWDSFPVADEEKSPCIDRAHNRSPMDADSTRGDMGALYFDQGNPSVLYFDPDALIIDEPEEFVINVIAEGDRAVNWEIDIDVDWLDIEPIDGILYPDQDIDVFARVNAEDLDRGRYAADIVFLADNPNGRAFIVETIFHFGGGNPPVWGDIPEKPIIVEGANLTFELAGADPEDEEISIRMRRGNLPRSARLEDNEDGTATFTWRPSHLNAGEYLPTFILSDGVYELEEEFPITVLDYMQEFELDSPPNGSEIDDELRSIDFSWGTASRFAENDDVSYKLHAWLPDSTEEVFQSADTIITIGREFIWSDQNDGISVIWEVWAHDGFDSLRCNQPYSFDLPPLGVDSNIKPGNPNLIAIDGLYPNPFNGETALVFSVARLTNVDFSLYDINGKLLSPLHTGIYKAGRHSWHPNLPVNQPSGIYLVRVCAGKTILYQRLVLVK